jgi:hypothetical protein
MACVILGASMPMTYDLRVVFIFVDASICAWLLFSAQQLHQFPVSILQ